MNNVNSNNMEGVFKQDFELTAGNLPLNPNIIEDYPNEFFEGEYFNNATGGRRKKGKSKFAKFWSYTPLGMLKDGIDRRNTPEGLARRKALQEQRYGIRKAKVDAKQTSADAQKEIAKGLQDQSGDIALANALASKTPDATTDKKMSTTTKVMIGVGVAVILAVIGFIVYKKVKK